MRNIFLVLVLANLAFAAWHNWFSGSPAPTQRVESADTPGIMLASEIPAAEFEIVAAPTGVESDPAFEESAPVDAPAAAPSAEPDGADAEPRPVPADLACVSVGPFRELSQAATAAANLRGEGFDPVQRAGEGDIWVGYWVYIEQIPSVDEANSILARLRQSGIADSYVIPNSDSGTLVSLGVFTEITRAGRRREEARALGLEATISDRTRRATVYWVDVLLPRGDTLDFDLLQPPGRIIRLEQRPCERA